MSITSLDSHPLAYRLYYDVVDETGLAGVGGEQHGRPLRERFHGRKGHGVHGLDVVGVQASLL